MKHLATLRVVAQNHPATIAFFHYTQAVKMKTAEASYPHNHHQKRITIPFLCSRRSVKWLSSILATIHRLVSSIVTLHCLLLASCGRWWWWWPSDGSSGAKGVRVAYCFLFLVVEPYNLWSFLCRLRSNGPSNYRMPFLDCFFRELNEVHFTCFSIAFAYSCSFFYSRRLK